MSDLESRTRYEAAEAEPRVLERWLASGLVHPEPEGTAAENYSIAIPPPNVTGSLHMGHALNSAIQDCLIRAARLRGQRAKWILGTDHAGIATQSQVEKALAGEGTSRTELGREAFVERVWEWRREHGGTIVEQLRRLGATCDYEDERFTLDDGYAEAVLKVFVDLYQDGLIYRDRYMVNWDPGLGSAISDLEVETRECTDTLYAIDYDVVGGGTVTIATVRPETMLGDTAVAVNPADERFKDLIGKTVVLPLAGREIPIIGDDYVKTDFGTGCLKITPAHDPNDFEIGRRHGLDAISVIGEDGRMTAAAGERFAGLTTREASDAVVAALEAEGRLSGREPYVHEVPFSHRSGERIEPLISLQWFMDMTSLAAPAIEAVTSGRVRISPDNHRRVYLEWMENIRPWCISRQLWWGHRLPVYYCDAGGHTVVAATTPEACPECGGELRRDEDVLDTWFSSALWPFATLGWPGETPELRAFYPTDVLLTARDILFLWVARMIMMGLRFTGEVPFADVYVHSIIQAPDGRRMSKSLGTGIDPRALIDGGPRPPVFAQGGDFPAYGADAVRFGLLAMSSVQDVRFSEVKVQQGQQLANKLWNASRLILLRVGEEAASDGAAADGAPAAPRPATAEDRWILSRLASAKRDMAARLAAFDFAHAALGLYDFVYGDLCDWYLELVKPRLYEAEGADGAALRATLLHVLRETLALAHPLIPFVTEEIWRYVPGTSGLLAEHRAAPADEAAIDPVVEDQVGRAIGAIQALRAWRDEVGVKPGAAVPARLEAQGYDGTVGQVARLARLELAGADAGAETVATVVVPGGVVHVLAGGGFDPAAAEAGRDKRRAELTAEIARAEGKLANEGFVAKAPPAVVQAERDKLERLRAELDAV